MSRQEEEEEQINSQIRQISFKPVTSSISGTISKATYSGTILEVWTYNKDGVATAFFVPGEDVVLAVYYTAQRANGLGALFVWHANAKAFDEVGKLLGEKTEYHSMAPWTAVDYEPSDPWKEPIVIHFPMPNKDFKGKVELWLGG